MAILGSYWETRREEAQRRSSCRRRRRRSRTHLFPLAVPASAELQELHGLEGEPLGNVDIVGTRRPLLAVLDLVHLPRVLALEIRHLLLDLEGVAAEDAGEFLDGALPLRPVAVSSHVPVPEDSPLLVLPQEHEGLVMRPLHGAVVVLVAGDDSHPLQSRLRLLEVLPGRRDRHLHVTM